MPDEYEIPTPIESEDDLPRPEEGDREADHLEPDPGTPKDGSEDE